LLPAVSFFIWRRRGLPAPTPPLAGHGRLPIATGARTGCEVLLAPLAVLLAAARAAAARPATLVALTVLLVCVPVGNRDITAAVHVAPADLASVALIAAIVPRVLGGDRLPRSRLWAAMAAAGLGFGLATLASQDPVVSLSGFVRYLQLFVLVPVAVVLALRERRDLQLVCAALLVVALIEGVVGTQQYLTGTGASFGGQDVRAVGTFGALDIMGMSTVIGYGLVVAFGLALVLRGRARFALLALAMLLVLPLLFSLSRGAAVATAGAIAIMLLAASQRLALRAAVFGGAAAIVLIGLLGGGSGSGTVGARLASISSSTSAPDRSVSDRYELWQTATGIWRDHPWIGVGLKKFPAYRDSYAPLHLSSGSDIADPSLGFQREPLLTPHNMYLLVLSEQGLVGGFAFGGLLLFLAVMTWRRTRQAAGATGPPDGRVPDGRLISVAAVGIVAWAAINFLFGDIGGPSTVLVSVMIGLASWWAAQARPDRPRRAVG
jgi:O-antigen ligase